MEDDEKKATSISKPEWVPLVMNSIKTRFSMTDEQFDELCKALIAHRALIAGGFILQAVVPQGQRDRTNEFIYNKGDIDIYVPIKETPLFIEKIFTPAIFGTPHQFKGVLATLYCRSFLRRNGIRDVKTYRLKDSEDSIQIDLMSVRNRRSPIQVVSNFDLTFCQIWFDGESVYATHPEHIETRSGLLQNDYVETYATGNEFLRNRIKKYKKRGFIINFDHSPDTSMIMDLKLNPFNVSTIPGRQCHPDSSQDSTLRHALCRAILKKFHYRKNLGDKVHYLFAIPDCSKDYKIYNGDDPMYLTSSNTSRRAHFSYGNIRIDNNVHRSMLPYEGYDSDDEESLVAYRKNPNTKWLDIDYQKDVTYMYINSFSAHETVLDTATNILGEDDTDNITRIVRTCTTLYTVYDDMVNRKHNYRMREYGKKFSSYGFFKERFNLWKELFESMLPKGEDSRGRKGPLLFLHKHDENQGITPESLKEYIIETRKNSEDELLKCFIPGCDYVLTQTEQNFLLNDSPFSRNNLAGGGRKRKNRLKHTFRRSTKEVPRTHFSVSLKRSK